MPAVTTCPQCSRQLRLPDEFLGKKVRCPGCKTVFVAAADGAAPPAPPPPPPRPSRPAAPPRDERIEEQPRARRAPPPLAADNREEQFFEEDEGHPDDRHEDDADDYGDEPAPRSRGSRQAWRKVASGISWVLIAYGAQVGILIFAFCGGGILGGIAGAQAGPRAPGAPVDLSRSAGSFFVLAILVNLLGAGTKGMDVYGHYLGMAVPDTRGTGAKTLAVTTFGLVTGGAVLTVIGTFLDLVLGVPGGAFKNPFASAGAGVVTGLMNFVGMLCYLAGGIVFILYLRAVAISVKRKDLGKHLMTLLIVSVSLAGVAFLVGVGAAVLGVALLSSGGGAGGGPSPGAANAAMGGVAAIAILGCFGVLIGLGITIWYVMLLTRVRNAVQEFARRG